MKRPLPWLRPSVTALVVYVLCSLALVSAGYGQSLSLASVPPSPAELAVIEVSLSSPTGKGPTSLQFETTIEGAGVLFVQDPPPSSPGAPPSPKSMRCAPKNSTAKGQTSLCILVGGIDPIPNGKVARLQLGRTEQKGTDPVRVRIDNAFGVYTDLRRISIKPVELAAPVSR
jgi:hypothetical protein